jgi:proteic killer suppression protein
MIRSIRHKGLKRFFLSGNTTGIQPSHAKRLRMLLAALDTAQSIEDMNVAGFRLHPLRGQQRGRWSAWVNGNWRMTFEFHQGNAYVVDYEDYH